MHMREMGRRGETGEPAKFGSVDRRAPAFGAHSAVPRSRCQIVFSFTADAGGPHTEVPQPELPEGVLIAPSCPVALSARAFGDDYPPIGKHWFLRAASVAYVIASLIYVPWLITRTNNALPWLAWPFLIANLSTLTLGMLS